MSTKHGIAASRSRVVLIFDIWHPALTEAERAGVSDLVLAIGDFRKAMQSARSPWTAKPFFRLPLRFDVERLQAEVAALPADRLGAASQCDCGQ